MQIHLAVVKTACKFGYGKLIVDVYSVQAIRMLSKSLYNAHINLISTLRVINADIVFGWNRR